MIIVTFVISHRLLRTTILLLQQLHEFCWLIFLESHFSELCILHKAAMLGHFNQFHFNFFVCMQKFQIYCARLNLLVELILRFQSISILISLRIFPANQLSNFLSHYYVQTT